MNKLKYFYFKFIFLFILFNQKIVLFKKEFCNKNWEYLPKRHLCLKLFNERIGLNIAEINCIYNQGHQISILDLKENKLIENMIKKIGGGIIWLGAAQFNGNYVWTDGNNFNFTNWKNKPLFNKNKKCIKMNSQNGEWIQSCCRVEAPSICQKPANEN
ncbi:hypothetical protein Mgra_00002068 [Meloidogyne graminicola]|uniref:C-type lectin domain-containing protein n=1 Tax=Meloidogyne graminicola TaxID=189291 RepID=A0A8S9ZZ33_9BILA|nr:hypothetical protein Mgra_00002068 [Meloidogyne graminicola]